MIGTINYSDKRAAVVGGGISGLFAAYYLAKAGFEIVLYEKSSRLGGLIYTEKSALGTIERAASSLVLSPELQQLCDELGVELVSLAKRGRKKFIYRELQLRTFPLNFFEAATAFLRAAFVKADGDTSASMYSWGLKHLGLSATQYLIEPMITGIYGADARDINIAAAFPLLAPPRGNTLLFGRAKSHKKIKRVVVVPLEGIQQIVDRMVARLRTNPRVSIKIDTEVTMLPDLPNVVLCTPARAAAQLLQPVDATLSSVLHQIKYSPLISATVFLKSEASVNRLEGIGVLVPPVEQKKILGVLFNSVAFPHRAANPDEAQSLTVLLGGHAASELMDLRDSDLQSLILEELKTILKLNNPQALSWSISRYTAAIPIYSAMLLKVWQLANDSWCQQPGRVLFGNYTGEVSIRGLLTQAAALDGAKQV